MPQECLMNRIIGGSEVEEAVSGSGIPTSPTWSGPPRKGRRARWTRTGRQTPDSRAQQSLF